MPFFASNFQTKILSRPRSTCSTNRPDGSAWIMCAWVRSWPLMAKLPGGALVALVGPSLPLSVLTSVASPKRPSSRTGSTATEPPK